MNPSQISKHDRILGGLWGCAVGDALGVPMEFKSRGTLQENPVTDMRGGGSHGQPPGTWSDDTSLMLCIADSLLHHAFDTTDMAQRFRDWYARGLWTAHGVVFDIGIATQRAICRFEEGEPAEKAGGRDEGSNGNGSLMRQLPLALRFAKEPAPQMLDRLHRVSAITHGHLRSQMACGFHGLMVRALLEGLEPKEALQETRRAFEAHYREPEMKMEWAEFRVLLQKDIAALDEEWIGSGGYVMETLLASIWCLLTTTSFEECVLKAVNLGSDTDTTGCVAGGLAGIYYGVSAIPNAWRTGLARFSDLESLFADFALRVQQAETPSVA